MNKLIFSTITLLFYVFPTGILASGLVTEINVSDELMYSDFYKTKSFYFIIIYSLVYLVFILITYIFKEKINNLINSTIDNLFERGQLKVLKDDIHTIKSKVNDENNHLPRVIHGAHNYGKVICVLSPSPLFIFDSITSIYYSENEYEKLIGIGRVSNIQENKKIQVEIIKVLDEEENLSIFNNISNNDNTKLSKIIIKPNVSTEYLNY